ncbi:Polyadenylate-binding protein-interacting protein 2B [Galemys pyrenaicus]|uniref:Polyadenylate-binding protein-interacting protein 2B n=1 Tax=Galemys pyrenaicus TaxID=202257 RepID=A0A8J6AK57_GALPY|nr:Polyadenylate-binding protein-interacting protein 2B [Galemys pyrenaicus]
MARVRGREAETVPATATSAAEAETLGGVVEYGLEEGLLASPESIIMNGSSVASTSPNVKSKEDQGLNGHDEKENPFAEYMWMENEEDFNRQVEEELQEQDFLDRCFQEMLDEEDQDWFIPSRDLPQAMGQLQQQLNGLSVSDAHDSEDILVRAICI